MKQLDTFFRRLRGDEQGTAIVELALLAPILALLTVGIVDLSQGVTRRMEISEAVHRTLEMVTSQALRITAANEPDALLLKKEAAAAAGVDESDVTISVWLECDGEEQDEVDMLCAASEATARYVQVRIDTSYTPTFGSVVAPEADGTVPLWAEAAVRIL